MAELSTLELAKVDSCQTLLSEWEMVTTNPPFPTSVWQLLLLTKKKCHHDPITLQCLTPYTPTSHPSSTEVQSESIARSQGLVKSYCGSEVTQAGGPYYSCCTAKQEENCKRNFRKHFLSNLETKLLAHSVHARVVQHLFTAVCRNR